MQLTEVEEAYGAVPKLVEHRARAICRDTYPQTNPDTGVAWMMCVEHQQLTTFDPPLPLWRFFVEEAYQAGSA